MSASFQAPAGIAGKATLVIEGMDSEDDVKTPMRISVNGVGLWEGASPFPNDDIPLETGRWGALTLQFDASLLQPGANTLTITNLAPGGVGRPPFVAVDYAVVQLP